MATKTPALGARGQGWKGLFFNSTDRYPSRCVRVRVHQRARRLKFLRLGMPSVALIRGAKYQRSRLDFKFEGIPVLSEILDFGNVFPRWNS